ncbi:MAG: 2OG-Fe(II) oxygenase [Alphaproteobacteria bacterium]
MADPVSSRVLHMCASARGAFADDECDAVIELARAQGLSKGIVGQSDVELDVRDSDIARLGRVAETEWLYKKVFDIVQHLNSEAWKFDLFESEDFQVAEYTNAGHYDWHLDISSQHPFSLRKLGVTVQLSDGDSYEGGNFEALYGPQADIAPRERGTIVIFPSFVLHRVAPVTSGSRFSLTAWVLGKEPFK